MRPLDFQPFDADNHYYEAEDAFTRHMDKRLMKRGVQWVEVNGRRRILVGGKLDRFIPNPTFDPIARPGSLDEFFRGKNPSGKSMAELFGDLEPIRAEYRDRDARLKVMDEQGLCAVLLFPTLGVGLEHPLRRDIEASCAVLRAFNRWLDEDWGFSYRERIFAVPMLTLSDVDWAVEELEWCLARDARVVHLRAAPVPAVDGTNSPADPVYDPFWARVNEAGIAVALHAGDHGYGKYAAAWERRGSMEAFRGYAFGSATQAGRAIFDALAALVIHGLFQRHPRLRIYSVENGSEWAPLLLQRLVKCQGQFPNLFREPALDTFRRHVSIAPYYEDDIRDLADRIGCENVIMGSDWPHAEGLADPLRFVDELEQFSGGEVRSIMHDSPWSLVTPLDGDLA